MVGKFGILGLVLAFSATASARDFPADAVAADATFAVHVDLQGLLKSKMFGLLEGNPDLADARKELAEVKEKLGIDPFEDIDSLTVYGRSEDPDDAVVLLEGSSALSDALNRLDEMPEFQESGAVHRVVKEGATEIHLLLDGDDGEEVLIAVHGSGARRRFVVAQSESALIEGIEVMNGAKPSLASSQESKLRARPRPGTLVFVALSGDLDVFDEFDVPSAVFELSEGIVVNVGETGDGMFARVSLNAPSKAKAQQLRSVLQGVVALVSLVAESEADLPPAARDLLTGLRFGGEGARIDLELDCPFEVLRQVLSEINL